MLCKMTLLCSLIITMCAWIFLVFMSRLDMLVQSLLAVVFSVTLITLVFYFVMDIINMIG